jgi:hypothetical protein
MTEMRRIGIADVERDVDQAGVRVHMVQQAAGPLPRTHVAKRNAHLFLEQMPEARDRQVHARSAFVGGNGTGRIGLDALQHARDALVERARGQRRAEEAPVEIARVQVERAALRSKPAMDLAHMRREVGCVHRAAQAQERRQPARVDRLGLDQHDEHVAALAGDLVGHVRLDDRDFGRLPFAPVEPHAQSAIDRDVRDEGPLRVQASGAEKAGIEEAVLRDPHDAVGAGAAPGNEGVVGIRHVASALLRSSGLKHPWRE